MLEEEHRTKWLDLLDWVIVGGESGPGARPMDIAWARDIVRQCREAGSACFVKQLGAVWAGSQWAKNGESHWNRKGGDPAEWPEDLRVRQFPIDGPREWAPVRDIFDGEEERNPDIERVWQEFWKDLVCDDAGAIDLEKVKAELFDYKNMIGWTARVYDHITGGRISKPNTDPVVVCNVADDHYEELRKLRNAEDEEERKAESAS